MNCSDYSDHRTPLFSWKSFCPNTGCAHSAGAGAPVPGPAVPGWGPEGVSLVRVAQAAGLPSTVRPHHHPGQSVYPAAADPGRRHVPPTHRQLHWWDKSSRGTSPSRPELWWDGQYNDLFQWPSKGRAFFFFDGCFRFSLSIYSGFISCRDETMHKRPASFWLWFPLDSSIEVKCYQQTVWNHSVLSLGHYKDVIEDWQKSAFADTVVMKETWSRSELPGRG